MVLRWIDSNRETYKLSRKLENRLICGIDYNVEPSLFMAQTLEGDKAVSTEDFSQNFNEVDDRRPDELDRAANSIGPEKVLEKQTGEVSDEGKDLGLEELSPTRKANLIQEDLDVDSVAVKRNFLATCDEERSEDPFNFYPLIMNNGTQKERKQKMLSLTVKEATLKQKEKGRKAAEQIEEDEAVSLEAQSREGVVRKLKRGRPLKSICKKGGLDVVVLDRGTILSDGEIRECNQLLIRMGELDAKGLWKIGQDLGLLEDNERSRVVQTFVEWDARDKQTVVGKEGVQEMTDSVNAVGKL